MIYYDMNIFTPHPTQKWPKRAAKCQINPELTYQRNVFMIKFLAPQGALHLNPPGDFHPI